MGNLFSFLEGAAGEQDMGQDLRNLGKTGYSNLAFGNTVTNEGLNDLRSQNATYASRLNDPLGAVGRGIFARGRGAINDDAVRAQRSGQARIFQQATQSGGFMSPEAQAELNTRNQRGISESLFSAEGNLANQEASMTLNETGKLFDRMDSIGKTITSVGQDEKTRALQSIIASLAGRQARNAAISQSVSSFAKLAMGG